MINISKPYHQTKKCEKQVPNQFNWLFREWHAIKIKVWNLEILENPQQSSSIVCNS